MVLSAGMALVCCRVGYEELPEAQLNIQSAGDTGSNPSDGGASAAANGGSNAQSGSSTSGGSKAQGGASNGLGGVSSDAGANEPGTAGAPDPNGGSGGTSGGGGSGGTAGGSGGTAGGSGGTAGGSGGTAGGSSGSGGTGGGSAGCTPTTYGGHDYLVCTSAKSFVAAAVDCATRGYRPVRIDSAGEQTFVHDTIPIADQNNNNISLWRWLGGDDQTVSGDWQWSDGTQFWTGGKGGSAVGGAYTNWNTNQPLNNAFCLAMEARSGAWYAMDCSQSKPYVCEKY